MCLAIPSKIVSLDQDTAVIDVDGVQRRASVMLLNDVGIGDYVIVHAGFAIQKIDEASALESLQLMREVFTPKADDPPFS